MLVLSRGTAQSVQISNDIEVVILDIKGDTVKLGFRAPHDVRILRGEIAAQVETSNQSSATDMSHVANLTIPNLEAQS